MHIDGHRALWRCWNRETTNWLDEQRAATPPAPAAPKRIAPYLLSAIVGALIAALTLPAAALAHQLHHRQSANWAGYAVTAAQPFRSVSGKWVQPTASCNQDTSTYAAFWVGLGGFKRDSQKLEQIGTESDCSPAGHARAFAWYELVPHASAPIPMLVHPGDQITAHVSISGDLVLLRIQDLTSHRTFDKTITFAAPGTSSAEWIAEAPSECNGQQCQPLPLTDFNIVQFADANATSASGHTGTITDPAFTTTEMILSAGSGALGPPAAPPPPGAPAGPQPVSPKPSGGATPTRPSRHGSNFAVDFKPGA